MRKIAFVFLFFGLTLAAALFLWGGREAAVKTPGLPLVGYGFTDETEYLVSQKVEKGKTFANIAESFGINYDEMLAILEAAKDKYNLEKIVEGKEISAISDKKTGELNKLIYQIDSEEALVLRKNTPTANFGLAETKPKSEAKTSVALGINGTWTAERVQIPYDVETEEISGAIDSSLFSAITESGGDERVALALAEMFAWQIDFATDIRVGDSFRAIYEKKFLNGNYIAPGNILAAEFINDGKPFRGIYFKGSDGKEGYYDLEGLSLQKIFLRSPLSYKYISSGFTYNRLNPVTRSDWGPHRAIDYAADYGTPVVTVGDGTVAAAGWHGGLGNAVFIRHNETYTTVYAHLSRAAVRTGAKVKQGQVIGYVGATGYATGPHLHFEMRRFGTHVNPLVIELPPGDPVLEQDKAAFAATIAKFRDFFEK